MNLLSDVDVIGITLITKQLNHKATLRECCIENLMCCAKMLCVLKLNSHFANAILHLMRILSAEITYLVL